MSAGEHVHEILEGRGWVVLEDVLTPEVAAHARRRALELGEDDRRSGALRLEEQRERILGLMARDPVFVEIAAHERVMEIAEAVVGKGFTMNSALQAHVLQPGAAAMPAHVDYPYWAMPDPLPRHPPLEVQAIWLVEDFTLENGAPRMVPRSQLEGRRPDATFLRDAVPIVGRAGSVVVSHGLCWHDTSPNVSRRPRVSLLANYGPWFVRPMEDLAPLVAALGEQADARTQQLLGMRIYRTLARPYARPRP